MFFKILAIIFIKKNRIWLVGERHDTAQENGYFFYKFLKEIKPHEQSHYIIDKRSSHFKFVKKFGNIIQFNSFKHKLYFMACKYYISSHNHFCFPVSLIGKKRYKPSNRTKNVFLPHGITMNDVSEFYGKSNSYITLFTCGAKPEFDFIKEKFGYKSNEVAYTGFARFDNYHNATTAKQVLLMPTWRRDIWKHYHNKNAKNDYFRETDYFKKFQKLLNSDSLSSLLKKYNYQLVFYPHYEIQPFINHFSSSNPNIYIASQETDTVQNLLKCSALLITDTSSVSFDFAYMYKPLIYYFFDKDYFYNTHIKKGYFDHDTMGFGEVIEKEDELILKIEYYLSNDCKLADMYKSRIEKFFPLHDNKNCSRIYNAIINS